MFEKVLIANRGEISVRIARACREMGVRSVAVYSDVDRGALHTLVADEAYHIGPTPAAESYLNVEKLIEVARESGAEAVHPGYGFLAESAPFARAVTEAGLVWIGPHPDAIVAMGSKVESRRIMARAGVPITPGTGDPVRSADAILEFAADHGFPVAVKASAGGGGKGFAVAHDKTQAEAAYSRASREGEAYFGDGSVYLEKYLPAPRHVEIQVFRDKHGNCVHLGERDCSIQRRHQKLVEECPSPALDPETRQAMGRAAVAAAEAVGYDSAGTVEFLLQKGEAKNEAGDEFFFLEMNTRVQVEHPVTEEVTGIDIVQTGIRIAAGEPLPFSQRDVSWRGHAIEVRINAEDAARDFVPSPGAVVIYEEPGGPGVRVDSSLKGAGAVPDSYDPLFAKLIVRGPDRPAALARLRRALAEFRVEGIATTLPFFRAILDDEVFVSGDYTTGFVAGRMDGLEIEAAQPAGGSAADEKTSREVEVEVNGRLFRVRVFGDGGGAAGRGDPPRRSGRTTRQAAGGEGAVEAPMQGTIVKVLVEVGQEVAADEPVCLLEAKKMESEVRAQRAGRVSEVLIEAGRTVRPGETLVVLE